MDPAPTPVSPPPQLAQPIAVPTGWSSPVQLALAFLLGVGAALLLVHSFGFWRWTGRPSELEQHPVVIYKINLNHANRAELLQLPGIGETLAQRIEEHRSKAGGFGSVEELESVPGIGKARMEQLRPLLYIDVSDETHGSGARAEMSIPPSAGMGAGPKKVTALKEPILLNQATVEELQRLPGIGPILSQRIIDERQKRTFKSVDDLRRVPGIGPKTLEKLRPFVTTESRPLPVTGAE